jgi:murein DD-endopeptidase MepM/ murein hydrolase activator NlpD
MPWPLWKFFQILTSGWKERTLGCVRVVCLALGLLLAAAAGAETLYRLPWPEGMTFTFTQASDGRITTHFTKATRYAVDIDMPEGVAVLAARDGVVEALEARFGEDDSVTYEGNFVRVDHGDGTAAIYAHLRRRGVAAALGDRVAAGQVLGYSGSSGAVDAPQLHFAVVRVEKNSAGWPEDVSIPLKFYIGVPPVVFPPRAALRVTANYSGPADAPRLVGETPLFPWKRRALEPDELLVAWTLLALCLACAVAGLAWFGRFSKR